MVIWHCITLQQEPGSYQDGAAAATTAAAAAATAAATTAAAAAAATATAATAAAADIRMRPTTRTQCPTLLRNMARVFVCATLHRYSVTHRPLVTQSWTTGLGKPTCLGYSGPILSPGPRWTESMLTGQHWSGFSAS